jgi:hypothetical protein
MTVSLCQLDSLIVISLPSNLYTYIGLARRLSVIVGLKQRTGVCLEIMIIILYIVYLVYVCTKRSPSLARGYYEIIY